MRKPSANSKMQTSSLQASAAPLFLASSSSPFSRMNLPILLCSRSVSFSGSGNLLGLTDNQTIPKSSPPFDDRVMITQAALKSFGETPITSCKFKFDSALTDVATMAATARVVENVGVTAYLGGATLITDPVLLTAAGSILTVEARHSTVLNILSSTGTSVPAAFDFALMPSEVLAIAGAFIDGPCDLGITGMFGKYPWLFIRF